MITYTFVVNNLQQTSYGKYLSVCCMIKTTKTHRSTFNFIGCPVGRFSQDCNQTCPENCHGSCHPETGRCIYGCSNGWLNQYCKECKLPQANTIFHVEIEFQQTNL